MSVKLVESLLRRQLNFDERFMVGKDGGCTFVKPISISSLNVSGLPDFRAVRKDFVTAAETTVAQ